MKNTSSNLLFLLLVGIAGTIITGIGEFLLHFNINGYPDEIEMLLNVPLERASKGHFMVVFGAPLYFAGYYALYRILESANKMLASVFLITGIFSFSVGGVWVASRYFAAAVLQQSTGTADYQFYLDTYAEHYQSLVWVLRILVFIVSALWIFLTIKGNTLFPKWIAIFNPLFVLLLVFGLYAVLPSIGVYLAPTAMNVAHFVFFGLVIIQYQKRKVSV